VLLAEEFVLLTLDAESGRKTLAGDTYGPASGAALLVELALLERVSVAPPTAGRRARDRVSVTSSAPTDDGELDAMRERIRRGPPGLPGRTS
jgi:hypothetical protein